MLIPRYIPAAIVLALVLFSQAANACGLPQPSTTDPDTYTAGTEKSGAFEGCISLEDFVGKSIEVSADDPPGVTVTLQGVVLNALPRIVSVMQGAEVIRAKADNWKGVPAVENLGVRFQVVQSAPSAPVLSASWVFLGGQGIQNSRMVLTDGTRDLLRIACFSDPELLGEHDSPHAGQISLLEGFGPDLSLAGGERVPSFDVAPGLKPPGGTGLRYASYFMPLGGMGSSLLSAPEKRFLSADTLDLGGTLVSNRGVETAYKRLKAACRSGIVSGPHPGEDCALRMRGYPQLSCLDPEVGDLARRLADRYAALTALAPLSDAVPLWKNYSRVVEEREACAADKACVMAAMQPYAAELSAGMGSDMETAIADPAIPSFSDLPSVSETIRDDLLAYGASPEFLEKTRVLLETPDEIYLVTPSDGVLNVVHKTRSVSDLGEDIDPSAPRYLRVAGKLAAPLIVAERAVVSKRRKIFSSHLSVLHFVEGARDEAPVESGPTNRQKAKAVTRAGAKLLGWVAPDGRVATSTAFEAFDGITSAAEMLEQEAAAKAYSKTIAARMAAERAQKLLALHEREVALATRAGEGGYIYKAPDFWRQFVAPRTMESIFHGSARASDAMILGWAVAYDRSCRSHLPDDHAVHQWQSPAGQQWEYRYPFMISHRLYEGRELHLDPRLSAAAKRAQESPASALSLLGVTGLASGGLPDWDAIAQATAVISQPRTDAARLIGISGCDGELTRQFLANLVASAGHGPSVKEMPILSPAEAAGLSDPPPKAP